MITYVPASTDTELLGILKLQQANLPTALTAEETQSQGFVTVQHTLADLRKLNDIEPHLIAKDGSTVVAHLLAMTQQSKLDIPVLVPMFELFDKISYKNRRISDYNYLVVGQACVDKKYRGQGIFDASYLAYRKQFMPKYDFAITEIATTNVRSLRAHKRVGFQEIHTYTAPDQVEWRIVLWDWNT